MDYLGFAQNHDTNRKNLQNEAEIFKNDLENVEFRVHVDPNELRGIQLFWSIFRESCLNQTDTLMQE